MEVSDDFDERLCKKANGQFPLLTELPRFIIPV
mgnify:CR=1 FL=1